MPASTLQEIVHDLFWVLLVFLALRFLPAIIRALAEWHLETRRLRITASNISSETPSSVLFQQHQEMPSQAKKTLAPHA